MKSHIRNTIFTLFIFVISACAKEVITASDHDTKPLSKKYHNITTLELYQKSSQILESMGYTFAPNSDFNNLQLITIWRSTTSGSHYLKIFDRKDYSGAMGAYYQLIVQFTPSDNATRIDVKTKIKNLAGRLTSSDKIEKEFFERLEDATRSPNIKITNVGVSNQ